MKYTVEWGGSDKHPITTVVIEAKSVNDAFDKAVRQYAVFEWRMLYPQIKIISADGSVDDFSNSHFDPNYEEAIKQSRSELPVISGGVPYSSGWAILYRFCGGIIFVVGFFGTIAVASKNEGAGFQLAVMAIALTLTCFLFAFLIDVLTDMRHYLKRIAEKQ